jgi:hypothetical protein
VIETEHNTLSHAYINEKPDQDNYDEFEVMSVESISPTRMEELRKITSTDPDHAEISSSHSEVPRGTM